ncbi:hypothetical protein JAAARDRAFT_121297 [Jaapia argillacea MUCL 33604]|uniref:DNA damage-binding protein 1 n=1 Tax=Jaapia argillacea MUCL 33604 TaxID=933084 RepID=A0A067Q7Q2_9AGAM|nr:hypothetical protein JAAARDRAFT_121297 [Jaapia argillacea MUCL 33604]
MRVVSTFHAPSSVASSVKCRLLVNSEQEYLVVAKTNRLQVFALRSAGLHLECTLEIWGRVVALRAIPSKNASYSNLAVLTDHPDPRLIILSYTKPHEAHPELVSKHSVPLHERTSRHAEFFNDVLVHPSGRVALVSCYAGKLKVVVFNDAQYGRDFDVQLPELNVLSICFLPVPSDSYTIGILHIDHQKRIQLLSRDLNVSLTDFELSPIPSNALLSTLLSSNTFPILDTPPILIPVAPPTNLSDLEDGEEEPPLGGVLIVGGRKILFYGLASLRQVTKHQGKRRRLEEKKGRTAAESITAKEKEKERELRKRKAKASVDWAWSEVTAYCTIGEESLRVILGDAYGRLAMLFFGTPDQTGLVLLPLGQSSSPTSLTHLTGQIVYLGSHMGDSHLIRIHPTPVLSLDTPTLPIPEGLGVISASSLMSGAKGKGKAFGGGSDFSKGSIVNAKGSYVEVIESFSNIAPIMDAVVADTDGSGHTQIVTCSGGRNTGALKVIRNGADFTQQAALEGLENIINVWPIRSSFKETFHSHLLVSTPRETHVYRFENNGEAFTRMEPLGFVTTLPSLAVSNVSRRSIQSGRSTYGDSPWIVQVTREKVVLVEFDANLGSFSATGEQWFSTKLPGNLVEREILAASVNANQIVVALTGGTLILLNLDDRGRFNLICFKDMPYENSEISAVSCVPSDPTKNFTTTIVVSFWGSNHVDVLAVQREDPYLTLLCATEGLRSLPRSLLLRDFEPGSKDRRTHLLVGLADGSLVTFALREGKLLDKRVFSLGDGPVSLAPCDVNGIKTIFACASRACILSWEKERIHQSPMLLNNVVAASSLNTRSFSSCLLLATTTTLVIGNVGHLDRMHIRSIGSSSDSPRRITHNPAVKMFGVAYIRTQPLRVGDSDTPVSSFRILDDTTFDCIGEYVCEGDEEITAVSTFGIVVEGIATSYFAVGTVCYGDAEDEPTRGRLLIFNPAQRESGMFGDLSLALVGSAEVNGCVYAIANVGALLAAAVNTSVVLFRYGSRESSDSPAPLQKVADWNHNYFVTNLVSRGESLIAGDAISSISVLRVSDSRLQTVARDYTPLWPVAIETLDDSNIIGADCDCNLVVFTLQSGNARASLECQGSYHLGEMVNKFVPGESSKVSSQSRLVDTILPRQLFFTSSGRIGAILDLGPDLSLHMGDLQRNMEELIRGPGGVRHSEWRSPANSRGRSDATHSFGFLDGDFLEQFLALAPDSMMAKRVLDGTDVAKRLKLSCSQITSILETLQGMH